MTIVSISRKKICDAIAKEPTTTLAAGNWVDSGMDYERVRSRSCSVCAVGAVMRNALLDRMQSADCISDAAQAAVEYEGTGRYAGSYEAVTRGNPQRLVAKSRYMTALSAFFEGESSRRGIHLLSPGRKYTKATKQLKADCIEFVKKNFPAKLFINIDGALPARDVKVVAS